MAKKSNNEKGNKWHDENNGQFTSENGGNGVISNAIKVKAGLTSEKLQEIKQKATESVSPQPSIKNLINNDGSLIQPTTIQEANEQGKQILGEEGVVWYDDSIHLDNAFEFNRALNDIHKDFENVFKYGSLINYGISDRAKTISKNLEMQKNILNRVSQKLLSGPINNAIKNNFPGLKVDFFVSKLKDELLDQTNSFFGTLINDDTTDGITNTRTASLYAPGDWRTFSSYSSIQFSRKNYTESYKKNSLMELSHNNGFHLPTNETVAYDTAAHELGHFISYHCFNYMSREQRETLKKILHMDKVGKKKTKEELLNNKEISYYATKGNGNAEHIAEAFADVYSNRENAQPHNKRIVTFFKGINDAISAQ